MKYTKYIFVFLLLSATLHAQGGSVYSKFGLGDLSWSYSARRAALSQAGSALIDRDYLSASNPASWTGLNFTRIETGVNYRGSNIKDDNKNAFYSSMQFSGFMLGIPLHRGYGLSLVAGIMPSTRVGYEISEDTLQTSGGSSYLGSSKGEGGLSRGFIGMSYRLPFDVSLGASFDYYSGTFNYLSIADFLDDNNADFDFTRQYKLNGIGASFGIISNDFAKLFGLNKISDLRLAISYNMGNDFNADTSLILNSYFEPITLSSGKDRIKVPGLLSIGLSAKIDRKYMLLMDYIHQPWEEFRLGGRQDVNMRNLNKYSLGLEYRNYDIRNRSFWGNLAVRAGASYEQTQYVVRGKNIDELSASFGLGIPLDYENTLDISFQYGVRGTTDMQLMKENIYRMNFSLSLGEPWFIRSSR